MMAVGNQVFDLDLVVHSWKCLGEHMIIDAPEHFGDNENGKLIDYTSQHSNAMIPLIL